MPLVLATRHGRRVDDVSERQDPVPAFRGAPLRTIGAMAAVMFLVGIGMGVTVSFFNVYLDDGLHVSTAVIGTVTAATQLVAAPAALLLPLIIARFGHVGGFLCGRGIVVVSLLPIALIPNLEAATGAMLVIVSASAISQQIFTIHTQGIVPAKWRTLMSGVLNTTLGISWAATAWAGGWVIEHLGYAAVFLMASAGTLLAMLVFALVGRRPADADSRHEMDE